MSLVHLYLSLFWLERSQVHLLLKTPGCKDRCHDRSYPDKGNLEWRDTTSPQVSGHRITLLECEDDGLLRCFYIL